MSRSIFLALFVWLTAATPSWADSVLPLYLDEIVNDAAVAFQGTCTANRSELDRQTGFVVTHTTFAVTDVLKGSVGSSHTIKQIGGRAANVAHMVEGTPTFAVGGDYVVFLYGVSSAGFSSPVGLSQGRFVVRRGGNGMELSNGRDFKDMLRPYPNQSLPRAARSTVLQTQGELDHLGLDDFKQIVRQQRGGAK